mmetsp:Transcript_22678/g.57458  ORF Transcript_22678/g.57458 Transcript_22678/m.57458 type:complete len:449 (+) Transcript_22678:93-1439(+)|eukprot:CAMPEP_0178998936 /NCGR_PEP_ID=MMETSP0795-20121207/9777_1 /TAXON_ID=88552 /ORGANISM="Amoebophrya sp., Strain Ameob2" /LENGTH=448 /DNA_ID=CAMNT_0020691645 /DNA_START=31 /DNA_END=1377 /DNA_ORIENTATION=+
MMEEALTAKLHTDVPGEGATLYKHLCDLVGTCAEKNDPNTLALLEEVSMELKYGRFRPASGAEVTKHVVPHPELENKKKEQRAKLTSLVASGGGEGNEFMAASSTLRWAGLGFSKQESYQISLRIAEIAKKAGVQSVRFWGKILGTEKDYLVYEAAIAGQGVGADAYEARGVGANKFTYFVQNEALGALTQLPEVTTAQITKSRVLQKYFSGDLNKDIISCPWFGGKEIHLLRAQIARITHSCTLHVNGFHAVDEESGKLVEAEDFAMPAVEELGTQGTWVHSRDYILKNGKTSYPDGEAQEAMDEDTKAALDAEMEECPPIPVLTPIQGDLDQDDDGNSLAWTVKQVGDKSSYTFNDVTKQYTVTVVESKRWPGAFTVCQSSNVHNIYIGYGVKKETAMPILVPYLGAAQLGLPPIMTEPDDQEENPEPNPEEPDAASDGGDEDPPQ